jgi:hypothetical protein
MDVRAAPSGRVPLPRVLKRVEPPLSLLLKTCDGLSLEKVITDHLTDFVVVPGDPATVRCAEPRCPQPAVCVHWVPASARGCPVGAGCRFLHDLLPDCRQR